MLKLITGPEVEPVTKEEAKAHLRLGSSTSEDAQITAFIKAARGLCEDFTRRAFLKQTFRLALNQEEIYQLGGMRSPWWDGTRTGALSTMMRATPSICLRKAPVLSSPTPAVHYFLLDNSDNTMDSSKYFLDVYTEPNRLVLNSGESWPLGLRPEVSMYIEFAAGYGTTADYVPYPLKLAVLQTVAHLYEHRGDHETGVMGGREGGGGIEVPATARFLMQPFVLQGVYP